MAERKDVDVIDIGRLIKKIYAKRKLFYFKVWPITFVVSCLLIICVPRYYTSEVKLAPEAGGNSIGGTLGSLASTFGVDVGGLEGNDAIYPMLYPDLMEDNGFVSRLFPVHVKTADGEVDTDYYTYLRKHQKIAWWNSVKRWIMNGIKSLVSKKRTASSGEGGEKSPYWLSEEEDGVAEAVRGNINFVVDKQTAVITITATAQDPLVAKILADSVQSHLQQFVTDYRTNKARVDEKHYLQLYQEAEIAYDKSCEEYARMSDAYSNVVLSKYQIKLDNQEKDMQLKYNTLQTISTQLQLASAKVQERTPAFTVIKGASVPLRPAGPKRMIFVLGMLILVTFIVTFWQLRNEFHL